MKHGQLDDDGRCVLSGLRPGECAGCQNHQAAEFATSTWKAPVKHRGDVWPS